MKRVPGKLKSLRELEKNSSADLAAGLPHRTVGSRNIQYPAETVLMERIHFFPRKLLNGSVNAPVKPMQRLASRLQVSPVIMHLPCARHPCIPLLTLSVTRSDHLRALRLCPYRPPESPLLRHRVRRLDEE
jgi:hypothetical protein